MRRRFGVVVVLGALTALALAAVGAFRHVDIAYGWDRDLMRAPLAFSSSATGAGHLGSSLALLVALAGAGAASLIAYSLTQQRRRAARVRIRPQRGPESCDVSGHDRPGD